MAIFNKFNVIMLLSGVAETAQPTISSINTINAFGMDIAF